MAGFLVACASDRLEALVGASGSGGRDECAGLLGITIIGAVLRTAARSTLRAGQDAAAAADEALVPAVAAELSGSAVPEIIRS